MLNVAIIGAGAGGLCAARHITSRPNMKAVVYEQTSLIGGAWVYSENTGKDKNGLKVHSAMYKHLRTNLPKELMGIPDFPFDKELPSFLAHEQVLSYIQQYCEKFNLRKFIQFETLVKNVKPVSSCNGRNTWKVTVEDLKRGTETTTEFDAVFVCNGRYGGPHMPTIPGQEYFQGSIIHSHSYRHPEAFAGKRVVLLGGRSSGQDISLEIANYAHSVVISHRTPFIECPLPDNVSQAATLSHFEPDGKTMCFVDGSKTEADAFIYCTGYRYNFPFLDEACDIVVEDKRIRHLYKHLINVSYPSMFFIGICSIVCPFPQFHYQAAFCTATLEGKFKLPPKTKMLEEIECDLQDRLQMGWPPGDAHVMASLQWGYNNSLAALAGRPGMHQRREMLYNAISASRKEMLLNYKENVVKLNEHGLYELLVPDNEAKK